MYNLVPFILCSGVGKKLYEKAGGWGRDWLRGNVKECWSHETHLYVYDDDGYLPVKCFC